MTLSSLFKICVSLSLFSCVLCVVSAAARHHRGREPNQTLHTVVTHCFEKEKKKVFVFLFFPPLVGFGALHENRVLCFAFIAIMKYIRSNSLKRLFSFGRRSFGGEEENDESVVVVLPQQHPPTRPSWKCFSYEDLFHATNGFSSGTQIIYTPFSCLFCYFWFSLICVWSKDK